MPVTKPRRTPGVYVTELTSFPPSIVGVQTAVPAFVGYTEKADVAGKPMFNKPIQIGSLADFEEIYGGRFNPAFDLEDVTPEDAAGGNYDVKVYDSENEEWKYYDLVQPEGAARFNLYDSMRLFYDNGGGNCWVVSVGTYDDGPVSGSALVDGLEAVKEQVGPTMLVVPEAILLAPDDAKDPLVCEAYKSVVQTMAEQAWELQDRVAVLDVYGSELAGKTITSGEDKTKITLKDVIAQFRDDVSVLKAEQRSYAMSYFPFVEASVFPLDEVSYTFIDQSGNFATLMGILSLERENLYGPADEEGTRAYEVQQDIDALETTDTSDKSAVKELNQNLVNSLPLLKDMEKLVVAKSDVLPSSGAMAGVYTYVDGTRGVWNAPANISLASVKKPTFKLNNDQQADLNVPVDGKAVDALREFTGRGTVVWGARTLDGNSNDYRYIQVRRTLIYIEQSIKRALDPFVFAANDGNTWARVVSMVSGFLQGLWEQGGLMGATASEAFTVECGLGSTMTAKDILEGYMIVQVTLQMIRPAEFIELTFKQKMEG